MKITLHELKSLVAQIISEGFVDELKELQRLHPREANALSGTPFFDPNGQPTKWFKWLLPRFLTKKIKEDFALDHTIDTVQRYAQNEQALNNAFRQQAFKEALAAALPTNFNLNKINDPSQLNVREMDSILEALSEYNEKKSDRLGIDYDAIDVEGDKLGKIGPWNIWMPTTRESSCTIVRVRNPKTGKMKKSPCTWCTIRTDGSNLFYNYATNLSTNIILYYLIKDNPEINNKENNDFISIGFVNGAPDISGTRGGLTVRCDNKGLKEADLKRIFGANYTSIINLLTQKTKEIGGQHPAKAKLVAASESLEGLNYLIKGISHEERAELVLQVLNHGQKSKKIDPDVENACFKYAAASKEYRIITSIVGRPNCPPHILEKLFNNEDNPDSNTVYLILRNLNCPPHILENFINNSKESLNQQTAIANPNCPLGILENLSISKNKNQRIAVAKNTNCPPHILENLFNDDDSHVSFAAFSNPNFPPLIKKDWELLINHRNYKIKAGAARDLDCPPDILEKLFNDDNDPKSNIAYYVLTNPNCPPHIKNNWELLSNHKNFNIREWVVNNSNCPPDILEKLFNDDNDPKSNIVYYAFLNPNFPPHIKNNWELLSNHKNVYIRQRVASNPQNPLEILIKISLFDNKKDPGSVARLALAQNPICPLEALENLVKLTKRKDMKKLVMNHPNCSPEILRNLSQDPDPQIASAALKAMKKRKIQLESLRRKISKLIYAAR